ncbi:unnamed protein product [Rotaria sordida]|uniref:LamG-like jellyroll fold domain-containing protein n=1 Tax=Rotaria sordida TaxID=392033 RepID=A0A818XYP6_9BILA|nr:unnamed protein product [Rotaria sordida]
MADNISIDTTRNKQRLPSSTQSAVTLRKRCSPTPPRISRLSRHHSTKTYRVHQATNSAKSMIVSHTRIQPPSSSASGNRNKNSDNLDMFPSITNFVNTSHRRYGLALYANQSLNEWTNNSMHSADINRDHRSLSQTDTIHHKTMSSTRLSIHNHRKPRYVKKRLSKSSSKDNISYDSIQFNSSTTTTTTTTYYVCGSSCDNQSWVSSSNLLAQWQFDNNLLEDVTNSITSSAKSSTFVAGYVNQAVSFGANVNQSLRSSPINLTAMSFTIDAWIYPTELALTVIFILVFFCDDCQGNAIIPINDWTHVAFVFEINSLTQSIYLNGNPDANRRATGSFQGSSDNVTVGNIPLLNFYSGSNYFQRMIDKLAITSRDKSACEILEEATLVAYFSFNSGVELIDSGPNSLSVVRQSVSFVSTDLTSLGITNRAFSISLWIQPQNLSGILVHVSSNSSGLGWCVPFLGFTTNGSIIAQISNTAIRSAVGPLISLAPVWSHIVETWSSTNRLRLYVNNVLVASTIVMATSYTASSVPNYVTLANSLSGAGVCSSGLLGSMDPYNGDIDELKIYSRELTAADICTLYTS